MFLYFKSRSAARAFKARKANKYRLIDRGASAEKRWAVRVW